MGPHQTKKFLHSKRNHEQNKPKQNQTHRYRGQIGGYQREKEWRMGRKSEADQRCGDGW